MNKRRFVPITIFIAIALLVSGVYFPTAGVMATEPDVELLDGGGNISSAQEGVVVAAAREWTKEEMEAAIPYPLPAAEEAALDDFLTTFEDDLLAEGASIPSGYPEELSGRSLTTSVDDVLSLASAELLGYSYPAPFTRYVNFVSYGFYPYRTVGKVFFNQRGRSYVCSASSMGNYAIWTAGHCVHDGSNSSAGWSTNVVFVPGYKAGRAPFGQWTADHLWTKTRWAQLGDLAYDMGGGVMNTKGGKKISQAVGWLGFSYNKGLNQHWHAIGYPQAAPFNGKFQWICTSSYAYSYGAGSPQPVGIGCDLTGGSSGGPWITKFQGNAGASNYINGVNSFRRTSKPKEMFSPYHGSAAYSLWQQLKNDTP